MNWLSVCLVVPDWDTEELLAWNNTWKPAIAQFLAEDTGKYVELLVNVEVLDDDDEEEPPPEEAPGPSHAR